MFVYDDIAFRVIERSDLETLRKMHNDPSTYMNILSIDFVDEEDQLEWWKGLHKNRTDQRYALCFSLSPDEVIGRLRIQNINHLHKNCEIGLDLIVDYRGRGLGTKCYRMVLKYLFEQLNMNMVYLKVAEFNDKAKSTYAKVGFVETGRFPKYFFRNGRYYDYILMSITREVYAGILPGNT
jgi:RimJ/RimL family protein N-acetyltransferase